MKILIVGASGLIGSHLVRKARAAGHSVVGTFRTFPLPGLVRFDAGDHEAAQDLISSFGPEAVVHAAGWTWVDGCEGDPERAMEENALQAERLARICVNAGAHFTYFSTSYVFDGTNGPYKEEDVPNPINAYSRSKWAGEQRVQSVYDGEALIPRVVSVFGPEAQKKNFVYQVLRAFTAGDVLKAPSDQISNPTFASDIGLWCLALIEKRATGIWNLASPLADWSRARWAEELINTLTHVGIRRHPKFRMEPVATCLLGQKARRPLNAGMVTRKVSGLKLPSTELSNGVTQMLDQDRLWYSGGVEIPN